jgi:hypothetical protein
MLGRSFIKRGKLRRGRVFPPPATSNCCGSASATPNRARCGRRRALMTAALGHEIDGQVRVVAMRGANGRNQNFRR